MTSFTKKENQQQPKKIHPSEPKEKGGGDKRPTEVPVRDLEDDYESVSDVPMKSYSKKP